MEFNKGSEAVYHPRYHTQLLYSLGSPCSATSLLSVLCVWFNVVVMGYYEWLKKGKDKVPHFTKRGNGKIMLLAGLWDSVQYEGTTPTRKHNTPNVSISPRPYIHRVVFFGLLR